MFEEGNIVYFTPFYFPNGRSAAKPKYCIILKSLNDKTIIASLPTRTDSIPSSVKTTDGCIELPDINLNCFAFSKDIEVTEDGKKFDFPTFIYGHQLDSYEMDLFNDLYRNEGTDYEIWGKIKSSIFESLLDCLRTSASVKAKFTRLL